MSDGELLLHFERMLEEACPPDVVRAVENGPAPDLWATFRDSGFLDALVHEAHGGAGLTFAEIGPLLQALGRFAVPVPVGETIAARALLAVQGADVPDGWIVLDTGARNFTKPVGDAATHRLTSDGQAVRIGAERSSGDVLRPIAGVIRACAIAGAADRALSMTVAYAGERNQFGKPIGKQQAIQQQLAVMAEKTVACRLAAQIGCAGGFPPSLAAAAIAKQVTSAAAAEIANIAHAVHGAIGISAEYDLQLYTRRLHHERITDGSASYWARQLGAERLAAGSTPTIEFVRERLA
jgi:acyl-CoA dehydrogenase